MADIYAPDYNAKPLYMAEAGNAWAENYSIAKAAAQNDKLYLGVIPAGVQVDFARLIFEDGGTGVTLDVGYEPMDGSTPAAVGDYFIDGQDVATAAGSAFSAALPITFEKPVKLVATVLGAALTNTPRFDVILKGKVVGVK